MMTAYDEIYLAKARSTLGSMLDFAVNQLEINIRKFWDMFLVSNISNKIEKGDSSLIAGKSGIELCLEIVGDKPAYKDIEISEEKKSEYWAGWALSYYQWETALSFIQIDKTIPIENIVSMYFPYHEMDIRQFRDRMNELMLSKHTETNLKRIRKAIGLTQSQLAEQSGVPLRTVQQYEQGQKNINAARSEYIISLSKVLYCSPDELLEQNFMYNQIH